MMSLHWMPMSLGVPGQLSMKSGSLTVSHSRSDLGKSLHHCWEEVHTLLWDMLDMGAIHPSQSPWSNAVVLMRKKDGTL